MTKQGPLHKSVLLNFFLNVIYCIIYEHSLRDKICDLNVGESQKAFGGSPKVFLSCINIGELDVGNDFFLDRFVRVCCKNNYFLLQ